MNQDPQTYEISGACMAVHSELGHGFLEAVYHEALVIELAERKLPFLREHPLRIHYRGQILNTAYRADFLCHDSVVLEVKALTELGSVHEAQVLNYLKATGYERGLLVNFGAPRLEYKRLVFTADYRREKSAEPRGVKCKGSADVANERR